MGKSAAAAIHVEMRDGRELRGDARPVMPRVCKIDTAAMQFLLKSSGDSRTPTLPRRGARLAARPSVRVMMSAWAGYETRRPRSLGNPGRVLAWPPLIRPFGPPSPARGKGFLNLFPPRGGRQTAKRLDEGDDEQGHFWSSETILSDAANPAGLPESPPTRNKIGKHEIADPSPRSMPEIVALAPWHPGIGLTGAGRAPRRNRRLDCGASGPRRAAPRVARTRERPGGEHAADHRREEGRNAFDNDERSHQDLVVNRFWME